jgi:subtilisin family serine protease
MFGMVLIAAFILVAAGEAAARNSNLLSSAPAYVPDELLVKYRPEVRETAARSYKARFNIAALRKFKITGYQQVKLPKGTSVEDALELFMQDPDVEYAEPNYYLYAAVIPDDTHFNRLWGLHNTGQIVNGTGGKADADMDAPEAWDITTGTGDVVVAVIDTGIDYRHPDLAANTWINPAEIPANGVDDDGNGYVDDIRGWDFLDNDNDPMDAHGHGTHVAGTIAAVGNNGAGVAGVNWSAKIMPLRFLNAYGVGDTAGALAAIEYAEAMGAAVINNSWSGGDFSQALKDAIDASSAVVVCAAGNDGLDTDLAPQYPSGYTSANIIAVAASDQNDNPAAFSNFGVVSVDVAAPGTNIYSCAPARQTIWVDNFEDNDIGNWVTGGIADTWATTGSAKYNDAYSLTDSPGGNYVNDTDSWARTPVIDLSNRSGAKLEFKLYGSSEAGYDFLFLEASTDAVAWTGISFEIAGNGVFDRVSGTASSWLTCRADLGAYDGQGSLYVRFRFASDDSIVAGGWYIDNVAVTAASSNYSGGEYQYLNGTSMAAPHVSGLAALIKAHHRSLTNTQIKAAIEDNVEAKTALSTKVASGGRVNAARALAAPQISELQIAARTETTVRIKWTTDKPGDSQVQYGPAGSNWGSYPSALSDAGMVIVHSITLTGLDRNTAYFFRIGSTDAYGNGPANSAVDNNPSAEYTFSTLPLDPPSMVEFPVIDFSSDTIDITFDEAGMQHAAVEANYSFSPSLNFVTTGGSDDITLLNGSTYRLSMASIPDDEVFTLTVSNITDADGNAVFPAGIRINDNDNDGMADDWETGYRLNPLIDDRWQDPDGDGYTNFQEYQGRTDPRDAASVTFAVKDAIPEQNAGLADSLRVPDNTSFAVLLESAYGIDIDEPAGIRFAVDDGLNPLYTRNLADPTVRVIKLSDDDNGQVTRLWVVYDRSEESALAAVYSFDSDVNIKINATDINHNAMNQAGYDFHIESEAEHNAALMPENLPDTAAVAPDDPDLGGVYDEGIRITGGDLSGAKILYDGGQPQTPQFGPLNEIPPVDLSAVAAVGMPLNLLPPTVFNTAVKLFVPCPGYSDVDRLNIYYYNGKRWVQACDAAGNVTSGGNGWMVPGSRVNHDDTDPAAIEIRVFHFSGAQAGSFSSAGGGGGGCFIGTISEGMLWRFDSALRK